MAAVTIQRLSFEEAVAKLHWVVVDRQSSFSYEDEPLIDALLSWDCLEEPKVIPAELREELEDRFRDYLRDATEVFRALGGIQEPEATHSSFQASQAISTAGAEEVHELSGIGLHELKEEAAVLRFGAEGGFVSLDLIRQWCSRHALNGMPVWFGKLQAAPSLDEAQQILAAHTRGPSDLRKIQSLVVAYVRGLRSLMQTTEAITALIGDTREIIGADKLVRMLRVANKFGKPWARPEVKDALHEWYVDLAKTAEKVGRIF